MATTSLGSALGSIATFPSLNHIYKQHDHVATTTTTTTSLSSSSTVRNHPSLFLGNRVSCQSRSVQVAKGGHAVRCFSTDPSERVRGGSSSSGRIIVTPFGPIFAPNYGTGRSGSNAGREWERRNQGQDERRMRAQQQQQRERERYNRAMMAKQQQEMMRIRQMIQEQMMRGRRSAESSNSKSDMALLRELEQRLRAASGNQGADQSSVDELVKEVEKRLRNTQGDGGAQPDGARENRGTTVYDFLNGWMKEWDKGVVEERERLQKQWQKSQPNSTSPPPPAAAADDDDLMEKKRPSEAQVYDPAELQRAEEEEEENKKKNAAETDHQEEIKTSDTDSTEDKVKNKSKEAAMKHRQSDGTVVYLKNEANGSEVYLVGTSHVSQQSADEVREVIRRVRPDYVMVELDRKRYESMMKSQSTVGARGRENPFAFVQQMVQTLANGNIGAMGKLVGIGLSGFYRLLATRGLQPGQEFKVAIEEGKNVGAKIVLGDQDIDLTMKHLGEQMSMQDAFQFFAQPMPRDVAQQMSGSSEGPKSTRDMFERLRDRKIVRRFNEEMEKGAPALTKVLLGERNEAMTKALRNLNGKVVAVVGLAHLDGMEQLWHEANHNFLTGKQ